MRPVGLSDLLRLSVKAYPLALAGLRCLLVASRGEHKNYGRQKCRHNFAPAEAPEYICAIIHLFVRYAGVYRKTQIL